MFTISEKINFYKKLFGKINIENDHKNISVKCPFCATHGKKKLSIRIDNDIMHCWVCGYKSRNLIPIIKKFFSNDILDVYCQKFYKKQNYSNDIIDNDNLDFPNDFKLLALNTNKYDPDIKNIKNYLINRDLYENDFWYYKFGFSNRNDLYRRAIMPSFNVDGKLNFFVARTIDNKRYPKYLNPSISKIDIIFNELNINWKEPLTIVEGAFDLVKCNSNATCLLGCQLSEESLLFSEIIKNSTPVILALDNDKQYRQQKIAKKLSTYDISVKILSLNGFQDVGEMSKKQFMDAKNCARQWTSTGMLQYKISNIRSKAII